MHDLNLDESQNQPSVRFIIITPTIKSDSIGVLCLGFHRRIVGLHSPLQEVRFRGIVKAHVYLKNRHRAIRNVTNQLTLMCVIPDFIRPATVQLTSSRRISG
jgi:hypothetical protein